MIKDAISFIKKPNDFVVKSPRKVILSSTVFKIIGLAFLVFNASNPIYFTISSICFFSASLYLDDKILKNLEPLFFNLIEKWINHDPDKAGFFLGRIFNMVVNANPAARAKGFYRGFFFQRDLNVV